MIDPNWVPEKPLSGFSDYFNSIGSSKNIIYILLGEDGALKFSCLCLPDESICYSHAKTVKEMLNDILNMDAKKQAELINLRNERLQHLKQEEKDLRIINKAIERNKKIVEEVEETTA